MMLLADVGDFFEEPGEVRIPLKPGHIARDPSMDVGGSAGVNHIC